MDRRNMDARDLVGIGIDPDFDKLELEPAVVPPPPGPAAPDPELPTTIEQLRNIIAQEVKRILSTVPRGEA